jgi:large subunit ribosomal protein L22
MSNEERPSRRATLLGERPGSYAIARQVRISALKVRRVVDLVRGMPAKDALDVLRFAPQGASEPVYKLVASAIANGENNDGLNGDDLYISQIFVDEGMSMKRVKARAKGRGDRMTKRSSHITVVLEPKGAEAPKPAAKPTKAAKANEAPEAASKGTAAAASKGAPKKAAATKAEKPAEKAEKPAAKAKKPAASKAEKGDEPAPKKTTTKTGGKSPAATKSEKEA